MKGDFFFRWCDGAIYDKYDCHDSVGEWRDERTRHRNVHYSGQDPFHLRVENDRGKHYCSGKKFFFIYLSRDQCGVGWREKGRKQKCSFDPAAHPRRMCSKHVMTRVSGCVRCILSRFGFIFPERSAPRSQNPFMHSGHTITPMVWIPRTSVGLLRFMTGMLARS